MAFFSNLPNVFVGVEGADEIISYKKVKNIFRRVIVQEELQKFSNEFESYYIPPFTSIAVKSRAIRQVTVESTTGTFAVGETLTKGSGGNTAVVTVYGVLSGQGSVALYVGPTTLSGSGSEIVAGDSLTSSGGATGTISSGGVGAASNDFTFTTSGGTESMYIDDNVAGSGGQDITVFGDRSYRFDVSDSSMSGLVFALSTTVNGQWGPDGTAGNSDDGTEYTTGKTSSGTPGSGGTAYVQYDFSANTSLPAQFYYYETTVGTAANSSYCLLYTSPSPRDGLLSRMPSSA